MDTSFAFARCVARRIAGSRALVVAGVIACATPCLAQLSENPRASRTLGRFDLDRNGLIDIDSDRDGLPDTWEVGGLDSPDLAVPFPAPQAIVPGTPPVSLFSRLPVFTLASSADSDADGLSDFSEVFGLRFIDENRNGVLDDATAWDPASPDVNNPIALRDASGNPLRATVACLQAGTCALWELTVGVDPANPNAPLFTARLVTGGEAIAIVQSRNLADQAGQVGEWFDLNRDGLPSIGEYPAANALCTGCFDYDGFVFTDPTLRDTDGDGNPDGTDPDPLINPVAFGDTTNFATRNTTNDFDKDDDGIGNGMDLGNDRLTQTVSGRTVQGGLDNPTDLRRVLRQFRRDVLEKTGCQAGADRVPEGLLEDLLGADWNGDGLFRINDVKNPHFGLRANPTSGVVSGVEFFADVADPGSALFVLGDFPAAFDGFSYNVARSVGGAPPTRLAIPLPYQELLQPVSTNATQFIPDFRIWTVLYSWRMPGVDVDGDGFIGLDSDSQKSFELNGTIFAISDDTCTATAADGSSLAAASIPSSRILIAQDNFSPRLDGQIEVPSSSPFCAAFGLGFGSLTALLGLAVGRGWRRRRTDR